MVRDYRYGYAWLFESTRGENSAAVGHVCARANTSQMNSDLDDISQAVVPGNHGVIVLDGTGWRRSKDPVIPDNLTLLHLPPYSPELNPVGRVFEYIRSNSLSNRVFPTVPDVHTALSESWEKFSLDATRIASITRRSWAKVITDDLGQIECAQVNTYGNWY